MELQNLVFAGGAVNLIGSFVYLRDTFRGTTKPNRVSFIMWSITPLIAFAAAVTDGVGLAAIPVFASGFVTLLILLVSFANPRAYWKLTTFDYLCGASSLVALLLWALTHQPVVAIALAVVGDGLATLPTLVKSWYYPKTETGVSYLAGLFSALTSFAAVQAWSFSEIAFPTYIVVANTCLVFAIYRNRLVSHLSK